jgi:ribosomal protein L9
MSAAQRQREHLASRLEGMTVKLKRQSGNKWTVTAENIAEKLKKQHRIDLEPTAFTMAHPIREQYGEVMVPVMLEGGIRTELKISIVKR